MSSQRPDDASTNPFDPSPEASQEFFNAAYENQVKTVRAFLARGVDVNARDIYGRTALHLAAATGAIDTAQVLVAHDADIDAADKTGKTPLLHAVEFGQPSMIGLLLRHGADLYVRLPSGGNVLHILGFLSKDMSCFVRIAIDQGVNIEQRDNTESTPLMRAAHAGDLASVQLLLEAGANPNTQNKRGDAPLHEAMKLTHEQVVLALLEGGADIDLASTRYGTVLFMATQQHRGEELVPLLLQHDANPFIAHEGKTPKDAAVAHGHVEAVKLLETEEAKRTRSDVAANEVSLAVQLASLFRAVERGDREAADQWLAHPHVLGEEEIYKATFSNDRAYYLMRRAIEFDCLDFARCLLAGGFDPNTDGGDDWLLNDAGRYGRADMAKLLLYHGAAPFMENERGSTPLDFASTRAVAEVICNYREGKSSSFSPIPFPENFQEGTLRKPRPSVEPTDPRKTPSAGGGWFRLHHRRGPTGPGSAVTGSETPQRAETYPPLTSWRHARWMGALAGGLPVVIAIAGAFYSLGGIHGGHYGGVIILALVEFTLLWLVLRIGRCERCPRFVLLTMIVVTTLGPIVVGHAIGYSDLKSYAYRQIQNDTQDRYPEEWKQLNRAETLAKFIGRVTGSEGSGVWSYLCAQAAIGWEGWEGKRLRTYTIRTGFWVWVAWLWHLIFFFLASVAAVFACQTRAETRRR